MPDITITAQNGDTFQAYIAYPENTDQAPGLVLIQEIFGVNADMRQKVDDYAAQGYIAICPDLFWRIKPGIQLTDKTDAEMQQAFDLFGKFDVDAGVQDIQSTLSFLRNDALCSGKVGAIGYCLGGQLAYLTATRTDSDASVGYYGVRIDTHLHEKSKIQTPLMLHIAGQDEFVPEEAQHSIIAALDDIPHVTTYHYPDADHAFARLDGNHYKADDAQTANQRSRDFLALHLNLKG